MAVVTMKQLLEAGVHFGHQVRRWDPRMAPYIFTERNGIHIVDLQITMKMIKQAHQFVRDIAKDGKTILFVGTKKQAQQAVAENAERCGMFFVNQRWMGGTLTNFQTIKRSLEKLAQLEEMKKSGTFRLLPKKETIVIEKEILRLTKSLGGIKNMRSLPGALFVIDPRREAIAVSEANKLNIPVVAVVDTNCDPDPIDYVIPGNDDAIRAINLIAGVMADAVLEGQKMLQDEAQAGAEGVEVAEVAEVVVEAPVVEVAVEVPVAEVAEPQELAEILVQEKEEETVVVDATGAKVDLEADARYDFEDEAEIRKPRA